MKNTQIFGIVAIILTIISNGYKYGYMLQLNGPYKIFPWQIKGLLTNTSVLWIFLHLTSAILLICAIVLTFFNNGIYNKIFLRICHMIFCILIFTMMYKFGNLPSHIAIIINVGLCAVLTSLLFFDYCVIYLCILLIPVIMEILLFVKKIIT